VPRMRSGRTHFLASYLLDDFIIFYARRSGVSLIARFTPWFDSKDLSVSKFTLAAIT